MARDETRHARGATRRDPVEQMNPPSVRAMLALSLALVVGAPAATAHAQAPTTADRTIIDREVNQPEHPDHNLLEYAPGEPHIVLGDGQPPARARSILTFLQMSDFQLVDEESPARVEFLDTTQREAQFRPFSSAYRPQESLTPHVVEAMVRAVREVRSPITGSRPRFTILTGDNADNQQYNETRWFIDILDGAGIVNPDSGDGTPESASPLETPGCPSGAPGQYHGVKGGGRPHGYHDPDASGGTSTDGDGYSPDREENQQTVRSDVTVRDFPGLLEAANRPFRTTGLGMPWYTAFGNHDALLQGNNPDAYLGPYGPSGETFIAHPFHDIALSCVKPSEASDESPQMLLGDPSSGVPVPADGRRCFLAKDDPVVGPAGTPCERSSWIGEHFRTRGTPKGHGFAAPQVKDGRTSPYGRPFIAELNNDGYYSFSPGKGLRFVALDSVTDECGHTFCSEGSIDHAQFQWLEDQLRQAVEERQHVVVYAHHSLRTMRLPSSDPTEYPLHFGRRSAESPQDAPTQVPMGETLHELFCRYENMLAYVSGHEHRNAVRSRPCPPGSPVPEQWEIVTAGHIDWPQQSRIIDVLVGDDGTLSLALTIVDHAGPPRPAWEGTEGETSRPDVLQLASIARELGYNDYQKSRSARGDPHDVSARSRDRNVIIPLDRQWSQRPGR